MRERLDTLEYPFSGLPTGSLTLQPVNSLTLLKRIFTSGLSDSLVTLAAAGYNYGVNWAIYTGGTFIRWNIS